jgi:hypothetical protein
MRLTHAFLVVVDISGYTSFITERKVSLLHAEQIITDLIEAVIDQAQHPLILNKLEGDAALLYSECEPGDAAAAQDVFAQVKAFFPAFGNRLAQQKEQRAHCICDACTRIDHLALKAFVHFGEFAIKQVRHFEELAGEEVILVHRLMKNHVPSREYVLVTEAARAATGLDAGIMQSHRENFEGVGEVALWLMAPAAIPFALAPREPAVMAPTEAVHSPVFHHLPQ